MERNGDDVTDAVRKALNEFGCLSSDGIMVVSPVKVVIAALNSISVHSSYDEGIEAAVNWLRSEAEAHRKTAFALMQSGEHVTERAAQLAIAASFDRAERAIRSLRSTSAGERGSIVAWRVKDFADGWILTDSKNEAEYLSREHSGAIIQPLYAIAQPDKAGDHLLPSTGDGERGSIVALTLQELTAQRDALNMQIERLVLGDPRISVGSAALADLLPPTGDGG